MSLSSIGQEYQAKYQPVFESVFSAFLTRTGSSKVTVKNYLTDLRNFLSWLFDMLAESPVTREFASPQELLRTVTADTLESYKRSAITVKTPAATINRRLTALRSFFQCAISEGWITDNPALSIQNIPNSVKTLADESIDALLADYRHRMEQDNTWIPTDADDIREFLTWYRNQLLS